MQLHSVTDNISIGTQPQYYIKLNLMLSVSAANVMRQTSRDMWRGQTVQCYSLSGRRRTRERQQAGYIMTYITWLQRSDGERPAVDWGSGPCNYHIPYNLWSSAMQLAHTEHSEMPSGLSIVGQRDGHGRPWSSDLCSDFCDFNPGCSGHCLLPKNWTLLVEFIARLFVFRGQTILLPTLWNKSNLCL